VIDSLYIAATGMQAQQLNVDTIANNVANANTAAFKKGRVSFTDLMVQQAALVQGQGASGAAGDAGLLAAVPRLGSGVGVSSVHKLFDLGDLKQTGSAFDVAIQGDGFIEVAMPDGSRAFTRGGSLKVNADGLLVTLGGQTLKPSLTIPANATNLSISADGRVRVTEPNRVNPVELGQLDLVRFANPSGLLAEGENLYRSTDASGEPITGRPGTDGIGTLSQGFLEGSNVKMVDEMVNLIVAQRAYEASTKVMQASDEMLGLINSLRR
jgi:flagellar basal-body rod protein FlgG